MEVGACGLNNTHIWTRKGGFGDDSGWKGELDFPIIQGADIVGKIVDVGSGVSTDRIGERVIVDNALYVAAESEIQSLIRADLIESERNGWLR